MISFAPLLSLFIYLLIIVFIVYFIMSVLQFIKTKSQHDVLLLQIMEEIAEKLDAIEKNNSSHRK